MNIITGNITEMKGIICHQVNCRNRIGAGVAGAIIKKWPEVEEAYHSVFEAGLDPKKDIFGNFMPARLADGTIVYNVFTQFYYGNAMKNGRIYTDMDKLISNIKVICDTHKDETVYVPYGIGCGLAGGNWDEFVKGVEGIENLTAVKLEEA